MSAAQDRIVEVRHLSKRYRLYPKPSDIVWELLTGRRRHEECWALRDVSFDLRRGEILGVIGSNGAGKTTLLRIIAGILDKTEGEVIVHGKVSAILSLGTSFNGDYTGRENVRLALLYAGLSAAEAQEVIPEVVAFSELASVIDHPVKTYSSGMQARLTFSTAIAVKSELLLIDEALATGDAYFVAKCLRHLDTVCRQAQTSALLVSHSMRSLVRLCDRAIYLRKGNIVMEGPVREVANAYEQTVISLDEEMLHAQQTALAKQSFARPSPVSIVRSFNRANGVPSSILYVGEEAEIVVEYRSEITFEDVWVGLEVYSHLEGAFVSTLTNKECRVGDFRKPCEMKVTIRQGGGEIRFKCNPMLYGPGLYFYHFSLFSQEAVSAGQMEYSDAILHQRYVGQFRVKQRDHLYFEKIRLVEPPLVVEAT
jgi:ABC-type polysaccharide/polyol phosphate transport system ATPase subunit